MLTAKEPSLLMQYTILHIAIANIELQKCMQCKPARKFLLKVTAIATSNNNSLTELEITVGHWPFSDQYCHFGRAKSDC